MLGKLNRFVVSRPRTTLAVFALCTLVLLGKTTTLRIESDIMSMMPSGHPTVVYYEWVKDYFGVENAVVLLIIDEGPDGVFNPATLALVEYLSDKLGEVEGVDTADSVSLTLTDNITADGDSLVVEPFYEDAPTDTQGARRVREAVMSNRMMVDALVSADATATVVLAETEPNVDKEAVYLRMRALVEEAPVTTQRVLIAGRTVVEGELSRLTRQDVASMSPFILLVTGLSLYVALRCKRGAIIPGMVVVASVIWTLGAMAWLGAVIYPLLAILPIVLIAIGVADGIHVIHRYLAALGGDHRDDSAAATLATMDEMAGPVVATSITTALGLASLCVSEIVPMRSFGFFGAIGVLAAMVFSLTAMPAMLALLPVPERAVEHRRRRTAGRRGTQERLMAGFAGLAAHGQGRIAAGCVAVLAISVFGAVGLVVDASMLRNFPKDSPVRVAEREMVARFGGSTPMEVVLTADEAGFWKEPAHLEAIVALQDHAEAAGYTGRTRSIADYVRRMNEVMNPSRADGYSIPSSRELVAQYLLLYSISGEPDDLDDVVDYDYRIANVRLQLSADSSPVAARAIEDIEAFAASRLAAMGIEVNVSGTARATHTLLDLLVRGQLLGLGIALVSIWLAVSAMARSTASGALATLPVAMATVINFGLLGWSGWGLGVTTAILSSMAIGIGVDYSIHFIAKYRRSLLAGAEPLAALHATMQSAGAAILYNVSVVVLGFLVLLLSGFVPNRVLGVLVGWNLCVCFLGTATVMASILYRAPRLAGAGKGATALRPDGLVTME